MRKQSFKFIQIFKPIFSLYAARDIIKAAYWIETDACSIKNSCINALKSTTIRNQNQAQFQHGSGTDQIWWH